MLVAIDVTGALDEARHIKQGADFGFAVLALAALVFGEGNAALAPDPGLSEIG